MRGLATDVEVDTSEAAVNSTRWVFNVVHDTRVMLSFELELLDRRKRLKEDGTASINIMPLDRGAAHAFVRAPEPDPPKIVLEADDVGAVIEYRVTLDLTHTLMR